MFQTSESKIHEYLINKTSMRSNFNLSKSACDIINTAPVRKYQIQTSTVQN